MFGRVLFAFVWLIIAVGVVLPLYPQDVVTAAVTGANDPVQLVAGSDLLGCQDCPVADGGVADGSSDCRCAAIVPAVFVPLEEGFSVTVTVSSGHSHAAGLPVKLPAI